MNLPLHFPINSNRFLQHNYPENEGFVSTLFTPLPFGPWGIAIISICLLVCLSVRPSTLLVNTLSHQCIDAEK